MNKAKTDNITNRIISKIVLVLIIVFIFFNSKFSEALENKILIKLNNEIITTVDISKEINYLKAFNKNIDQLDNQKIIKIAKNSIIKDRIKKIEILKRTKDLTIDDKYLNSMLKNAYLKIGLNSFDQFKTHLDYNDVKMNMVKEKITIDAYWKQIIYNKYIKKIKINKKKIINELSNRKNKFYNISEIMFSIEKNENFKEKLKTIKQSINNNGFENTALIYGISESSKNGGDLGWINGNALSSKIESELSILKVGEFTDPITIPGGFLILKVKNLKEESANIDIDKELQKVIDTKINEQLNQFSNLYINKVKKNIIINEL